jgi:hypothetical protein
VGIKNRKQKKKKLCQARAVHVKTQGKEILSNSQILSGWTKNKGRMTM